VLERNWRCNSAYVRGELDIVARDGAILVVCEVKSRRGVAAGSPLEAVTPRKLLQVRKLAAAYLGATGRHAEQVRIDAVGVCWPPRGGPPEVTHVRGIG
jgi:putative endonuclease